MRRSIVSPFRRVEARSAGAQALGILVPPGRQALVILRPRAVPWDLLPARWDGDSARPPVFCLFNRDSAAGVARRLQQALEHGVDSGINPVQTIGDAAGQHFQVWVRTDEYVWLVCRRAPGQAYQPALFASQEEAAREAERLTPIFWPAPDAQQEYYFNTQQFHAS
jgi:hypothetical protein